MRQYAARRDHADSTDRMLASLLLIEEVHTTNPAQTPNDSEETYPRIRPATPAFLLSAGRFGDDRHQGQRQPDGRPTLRSGRANRHPEGVQRPVHRGIHTRYVPLIARQNGRKGALRLANTSPQTVALACDLAPFSRLTPSGTIRPVHRAAAKGLGSRPSAKPAGRRPKAGEVARSVSQPRCRRQSAAPSWAKPGPTVCGGYGLTIENGCSTNGRDRRAIRRGAAKLPRAPATGGRQQNGHRVGWPARITR
jgi:hypothetical protein